MNPVGNTGDTEATGPTSTSTIDIGSVGHDAREHLADPTVAGRERSAGEPGPPPGDDYNEISWATMAGVAVVVKAARQPHRSRLRREAEVLARLAADAPDPPIAVELVELTEGADHTELVTRRSGSVTLAEVGLLNATERATALISLCEAVDTLHAGGWVHAALEPSHVLVTTDAPGERPQELCGAARRSRAVRLCSFADARQPSGSDVAKARSFDREALTAIVVETLDHPGAFGTRRERRRYEKAARRARDRLSRTRGLLDGAGMRAILLDTIARGTTTVSGVEPQREEPTHRKAPDQTRVIRSRPSPSKGWRIPLVAATALATMLAGAFVARTVHGVRDVADGSACTIEVGPARFPCEAARINQNVVTVGDEVLEIGGSEDTVLVGDWDCDGSGTAVLLEDRTGRLFHFESWASGSDEVTGEEIGRFQDAIGLTRGEACAYPDVELADGSNLSPLDQHDPGVGVAAERPAGGRSGSDEGQ